MAELVAVAPATRARDVFGKELQLTEAELKVLGKVKDVFLAKKVQVETRSKKGDVTEPRLLVLSSSRCYIIIQNPVAKLETSFNFLKLQQLKCSERKLSVQLLGETRVREFVVPRQDSVEIVGLITAQIKNIFPTTSLDLIMKLTYDPDSLSGEVTVLRDELMGGMDRVDATSMDGFLTAYAFLSDFFGVPYNTQISWYLKNVYLAHGLRELKLADFYQYTSKDLLPVVSSLRHNSYFEGVVETVGKVSPDILEELWYVLRSSQAVKTLVMANCALKPDNIVRLSAAITNNHKSAITHLDLSESFLEDKGMESLCSALESLSHGLQILKLANCKITAKGNSMLASSLRKNKQMQYSLVHLDLSGNPLGPDQQGGLAFLQEPQTITTLKLARCSLVLDTVVPVLIRGSTQHLRDLDLSHNPTKPKKVATTLASSLQKFCSSSISIELIKMVGCKLNSQVVTSLLEGFSANVNVSGVRLDVSSNELGGQNIQPLIRQIEGVACLTHLNLSDTGLDANMVDVIVAIGNNMKLRHVKLGRNFNGKVNARHGAVHALAQLLEKEDCHLLSVCLEDSHLKELTVHLLEALAENHTLTSINLNGNQMGHGGVAMLAKALLCNCRLSKLEWDHNDTSLRGFQEIAAAMKHNYTLRVMPLPLHDIARAGKGVEEHVQLMQRYLCRNHSDERLKVEMAARHRNRLLTATQQSSVVGRELVQLEDLLHWAEGTDPTNDLVKEGVAVKELANGTIKLTDGLYSPQVESEQFQKISEQVKEIIDKFMDDVFLEHIEARTKKMVVKSKEISGSELPDEVCGHLDELVLHDKTREFSQAKRDIIRHTLPEVVNYVSDTNVEVAAEISEQLVDYTLTRLDKINNKLLQLQSDLRPARRGTDSKVSRNFTFRAQDDSATPTGNKRKQRKRRADPEDGEEDDDFIDLPSIPLVTEGPSLQHLGKTRPKPARMHRGRPTSKKTEAPPPSNTDMATDKVTTPPPSPSTVPANRSSRTSIRLPPPPTEKPPNKELNKQGSNSPEISAASVKEKTPPTKEKTPPTAECSRETSEGPSESLSPNREEETSESEEEHRTVQQTSDTSLLDEINTRIKETKEDKTEDEPAKPSEGNNDKEKKTIKEKGNNLSKVLFQAAKPAEKSSSEVESKSALEGGGVRVGKERNGLSGEWEVLDGPEPATNQSPSPEIIKKTPPIVKGKPRKGDTVKEKSGEGEAKKVPLMPSEHLTSLASLLQKGPAKSNKSDGESSSKSSPAPPPKPRATEDTSPQDSPANNHTPKTQDPKDTKTSPAPAPKPKPKPSRGKEAEKS